MDIVAKTLRSLKSEGLYRTLWKIGRYPFRRQIALKNEQIIFNKSSIEDRFTQIYRLNYWGNGESVSGGGSTVSNTENLRRALPNLFEAYSIHSVFDAPCGDFNWMNLVIKDMEISYIGGDIVLPLIESNKIKFENRKTRFIQIDLTQHCFPSADLMICRDCLFHLSFFDTKAVIDNFVKSNIDYLLTTTYVNREGFSNHDIQTGYFRRIDLFSEPYNFPREAKFRISDWSPPDPEREMCLWSREQIASAGTSL